MIKAAIRTGGDTLRRPRVIKAVESNGAGAAVGTGETNTTSIVNALGSGSYAARLCYDLSLGGYDDWFLPSKDELNLMPQQEGVIPGFAVASYWSSSETYSD